MTSENFYTLGRMQYICRLGLIEMLCLVGKHPPPSKTRSGALLEQGLLPQSWEQENLGSLAEGWGWRVRKNQLRRGEKAPIGCGGGQST